VADKADTLEVVCFALQHVAACHSLLQRIAACSRGKGLQRVAVCCSVLHCVALCCSVLQCAAACQNVLQCAAVCYGVLKCTAVC